MKNTHSSETYSGFISERKTGKPLGPDAPHYPNKSERRELIRIMRKSGFSEDEVRQNPVHRQALAKARENPCQRGTTDRKKLREKRNRRYGKWGGIMTRVPGENNWHRNFKDFAFFRSNSCQD